MTPAPDDLGRYALGDPIGQGAIAEVFKATDRRTGKHVALKRLYPALRENPVVTERFRREVDLVRRIQHPHVLDIHELVEAEGWLALVMDYHPGGDLADRLARRGPLSTDELRTLAGQLGGALAAAHRAGIVHRDVKPSNVLVGDPAAGGLDVRLCDFGLARLGEGSGLTSSAAVLGTPEYMAPEVIAEGHADPRSDIYSMGAVLFEAATGRPPFVADSAYQLMRLHLEAEPPRLRASNPALPPAMEAAILRALAKDPLDRWESAEALVAAFVTDAPALASAPAAALTLPARAACPACGGWMVAAAAVCADCGHQSLRIESEQPGCAVLITGPGKTGDKLEGRLHVALHRLLAELPASQRPQGRRATATPRLPFYLARHVTQASAERLLARVKALGLEGRIHTGWALSPRELRSKLTTIAGRYMGGAGVTFWLLQVDDLLPKGMFGFWAEMALTVGAMLTLPGLLAAGMSRRTLRPLIGGAAGADPHGGPDALEQIGRAMAALESRQDRRLLARIWERALAVAPEGGDTAAAGVRASMLRRTAELAAALSAVQTADRAWAEAVADHATAQAEIRKLERGRVLLRTELLRLSSHLESLASAETRAGAAPAQQALGAAGQDAARMETELEAHEELDRFLAGRLGPA